MIVLTSAAFGCLPWRLVSTDNLVSPVINGTFMVTANVEHNDRTRLTVS